MSTRISDYIFETLLGQGTFGSVYLVRRKKNSKPFVVKQQALNAANALPFKCKPCPVENFIELRMTTKQFTLKRFKQFRAIIVVTGKRNNILGEVQCLHTLRHPNIVAYHGAWMEDNHSYILMEYATRCTLKDLLNKRETPLTEEDALYLFAQMVLGVHHIHYKKILHRDLKPENIMLTGSHGDIVQIGDFGVSKNFQESELGDACGICRAGSFYYMAPEMFEGQCYDFKCDIWSMGVVLYEMVTKEHPFPGTNPAEIMRTTCKENPRPLPDQTSPAIINLMSKMLRKLPFSRPKTDQLLLCPHLVPFIARTYLNLGRVPCTLSERNNDRNSEVFLKFLKPRERYKTAES